MSHGPFGLGGATFRPAPACWAIVYVVPMSVNTSAAIRTRLILVFMSILICLKVLASSCSPAAVPALADGPGNAYTELVLETVLCTSLIASNRLHPLAGQNAIR